MVPVWYHGRMPSKVIAGVTDVGTTDPWVVDMWSPTSVIRPHEVSRGSDKRVELVCEKGHKWTLTVSTLVSKRRGCPFCSGQRAIPGENDLATTHPEIAAQWHPTKNLPLVPSEVKSQSGRSVYWLCEEGHEWVERVQPRVRDNVGCRECKLTKKSLASEHPELLMEWDYSKNTVSPEEVFPGAEITVHWICAQGHEWKTLLYNRTGTHYGSGCPRCVSKISAPEIELQQAVLSMYPDAAFNVRGVIPKYELDIYCEDAKVAIEFNGLYWHREGTRDRDYHWAKTKACRELGITLIHVWEDTWRDKRDAVESLIRHKLELSGSRVYARNLAVETVNSARARDFLEKNHLQGFRGATTHLALTDDGQIRALLSFGVRGASGEIIRFATEGSVVGGLSRLMSHAQRTYPEVTTIVSYSANDTGNGNAYQSVGFSKVSDYIPEYMYVERGRRMHRLGYQKSAFKKRTDLKYDETKSERELAAMNGLYRVWTSGNAKWVKHVN